MSVHEASRTLRKRETSKKKLKMCSAARTDCRGIFSANSDIAGCLDRTVGDGKQSDYWSAEEDGYKIKLRSRRNVARLQNVQAGCGPSGYRCSFPGMKRPEREVNHLPPSSAEVKNEWSFRPVLLPLYAFMAWTGKTHLFFNSEVVRWGRMSVSHCEARRSVDADARIWCGS
jgi:hypothetical protein